MQMFPHQSIHFVAAAPFPWKQLPTEATLAVGRDITLFRVKYGAAQDCLSGCFFSITYGLRNGSKIAWFEIDDYDGVDLSAIALYEFDSQDDEILSTQGFRAVESIDPSFYHFKFLQRVAASTKIGVEPLLLVAGTLEEFALPSLAQTLLANPIGRSNRAIVTVIANLQRNVYAHVRAEARALLDSMAFSS